MQNKHPSYGFYWLSQNKIFWLKDSLPIMKLHKIDLFSPLMTEFELSGHFWSDKDTMSHSLWRHRWRFSKFQFLDVFALFLFLWVPFFCHYEPLLYYNLAKEPGLNDMDKRVSFGCLFYKIVAKFVTQFQITIWISLFRN